jgi:hypothetical protein
MTGFGKSALFHFAQIRQIRPPQLASSSIPKREAHVAHWRIASFCCPAEFCRYRGIADIDQAEADRSGAASELHRRKMARCFAPFFVSGWQQSFLAFPGCCAARSSRGALLIRGPCALRQCGSRLCGAARRGAAPRPGHEDDATSRSGAPSTRPVVCAV